MPHFYRFVRAMVSSQILILPRKMAAAGSLMSQNHFIIQFLRRIVCVDDSWLVVVAPTNWILTHLACESLLNSTGRQWIRTYSVHSEKSRRESLFPRGYSYNTCDSVRFIRVALQILFYHKIHQIHYFQARRNARDHINKSRDASFQWEIMKQPWDMITHMTS